jgi:hypothetical protein
MSHRVLLVTGSDAGYFPLVCGTIRSVRDKPQGRLVAIGFFDLGCTDEQWRWLRKQVDDVQEPGWDFDFSDRVRLPAHVRAQLARPFLPRYFPGYDLYLWLDADAWVQEWSAVELLLRGAQRRGLAIVPELDRGNRQLYGFAPTVWGYFRRHYQQAFGDAVAQELCSYPMLNSGAIALRAAAPHWKAWAEALRAGLQPGYTPLTEQLALNRAVYKGGLFDRTELLPAWCNWTTHYGLPSWDRLAGRFVEPYLPHVPIGILHLTGNSKQHQARVTTTDGQPMDVNLCYGGQCEPPLVPLPGTRR